MLYKHGLHYQRPIRCRRTARAHRKTIGSGIAGIRYRILSRIRLNLSENQYPLGTGKGDTQLL